MRGGRRSGSGRCLRRGLRIPVSRKGLRCGGSACRGTNRPLTAVQRVDRLSPVAEVGVSMRWWRGGTMPICSCRAKNHNGLGGIGTIFRRAELKNTNGRIPTIWICDASIKIVRLPFARGNLPHLQVAVLDCGKGQPPKLQILFWGRSNRFL